MTYLSSETTFKYINYYICKEDTIHTNNKIRIYDCCNRLNEYKNICCKKECRYKCEDEFFTNNIIHCSKCNSKYFENI